MPGNEQPPETVDEDAIRQITLVAGWNDSTADMLIERRINYQRVVLMFAAALAGRPQ